MFDVKTTGFRVENYVGRRSCVDEKAATVPAQYKRRAQQTDQEYNSTPVGTIGPVELKVASMPQVECFSVGAFGEVNKAVMTFLETLAKKGSEEPERFGCCHGKEQAKGVVAQFLRRRLGRTLLKGAVRVRHTALAAIGGIVGSRRTARAATECLGNEWDAAGRPAGSWNF